MTRDTRIRIFALAMSVPLFMQLGQKPAAAAEPPSASCFSLSVKSGESAVILQAGHCANPQK